MSQLTKIISGAVGGVRWRNPSCSLLGGAAVADPAAAGALGGLLTRCTWRRGRWCDPHRDRRCRDEGDEQITEHFVPLSAQVLSSWAAMGLAAPAS